MFNLVQYYNKSYFNSVRFKTEPFKTGFKNYLFYSKDYNGKTTGIKLNKFYKIFMIYIKRNNVVYFFL